MFELLRAPTDEALEGLLEQRGLLSGVEVYCLKEHAVHLFSEGGGVQPNGFRGKLLRKVLASARADPRAAADALDLFRVCRLDKVSEEPLDRSEQEQLEWWDCQLGRD